MNNTALGLGLAITLLLCHMYLETKTTELVDSLEVASIKFLNSVTERRSEVAAAGRGRAGAAAARRCATGCAGPHAHEERRRSRAASSAITRATAAVTT